MLCQRSCAAMQHMTVKFSTKNMVAAFAQPLVHGVAGGEVDAAGLLPTRGPRTCQRVVSSLHVDRSSREFFFFFPLIIFYYYYYYYYLLFLLSLQEPAGSAGAASSSAGMLVVESVVPGGPADGALEPGDVLVRLGGAVTTHFLPMDALLDAAVGRRVAVEVERGGAPLAFDVQAGPRRRACRVFACADCFVSAEASATTSIALASNALAGACMQRCFERRGTLCCPVHEHLLYATQTLSAPLCTGAGPACGHAGGDA